MFLLGLVFAMSLCASVYMCFVVTCWERADLLALVCGVYCESVTFPLVSLVKCGTRLYRFLIFAPLLFLRMAILHLDIMGQSACLVLNPITVYSYGFLFNCTMMGQASDSMTALT